LSYLHFHIAQILRAPINLEMRAPERFRHSDFVIFSLGETLGSGPLSANEEGRRFHSDFRRLAAGPE
jgi:hypothetical protein